MSSLGSEQLQINYLIKQYETVFLCSDFNRSPVGSVVSKCWAPVNCNFACISMACSGSHGFNF
jgi:hypothetical protein